jgi:hypothetical protein
VTPDRGDVGLADFAHALRLLAPRDRRAVEELASHVGLELGAGALARFAGEEPAPPPDGGEPILPPTPGTPPGESLQAREPVLIPLSPSGRDDLLPRDRGGDDAEIPATDVAPLPSQPAGGVSWSTVRLPVEPLLRPLWTAGVLGRAAATYQPFGDVDTGALVDLLSRYELPRELPRADVLTLARGVQVLVDIGAGMEPFVADQSQVVAQLRRIVGRDRTEVLQFRNAPLRGAGKGPVWTWSGYPAPEPGVPVVALTDLGLGGPPLEPGTAMRAEWAELAALLEWRGSPLLALVPYPPERWTRDLGAGMRLIEWNEGTGVQGMGTARRRRGS